VEANLKKKNEKLGISKMIVLPFGVAVIGVAPSRVRKIN